MQSGSSKIKWNKKIGITMQKLKSSCKLTPKFTYSNKHLFKFNILVHSISTIVLIDFQTWNEIIMFFMVLLKGSMQARVDQFLIRGVFNNKKFIVYFDHDNNVTLLDAHVWGLENHLFQK